MFHVEHFSFFTSNWNANPPRNVDMFHAKHILT